MFAPLVKATKPTASAHRGGASVPQSLRHLSRPPARLARPSPGLVQPKLRVGRVDDPLEREADRVADRVMQTPDAAVAVGPSAAAGGTVQRRCADCDEEIRRKPGGGPCCADGSAGATETAIRPLSGGTPLPAAERAYFEPRFGRDFSHVRLHADAAAGTAALSIEARAFTLGGDIAFAPGEYAPGSASGRRLLAHELAHVVQQADGSAAQPVRRKHYPSCGRRVSGFDDADDRIDRARAEALRIAAAARAAFPRLSTRTMLLADRYFHCPSSAQILAIMAAVAAIETKIPSEVRCVGAGAKDCRGFITARIFSDGVLELCPQALKEEFKKEDAGIAGEFVWAAAIEAGFDNSFLPFPNDFTVPADEAMKHAETYREFAVELAGYAQRQPSTIPCGAQDTGTQVSVPPGNPAGLRPLTGYDPSPPPGSVILTVYEDRAGHKFIYGDDLVGAQTYLPNEPKRFYLDRRIWAAPTAAEMEKMINDAPPPRR